MSVCLYPCPSCGFLVFDEPAGSYAICEVCGWEDDHVQLAHPSMGGGANKSSLAEHQAKALAAYPLNVRSVGDHARSAEWRPLHPEEMHTASPPQHAMSYFTAAAQDSPQYYWLRDAEL